MNVVVVQGTRNLTQDVGGWLCPLHGSVYPFRQTAFLENDTLGKMARSRMKTPSQLLIRRAIQRDLIVLCYTTDPQRIRSNINVGSPLLFFLPSL